MTEQLVLIGVGAVAAVFVLRPLLRGKPPAPPDAARPAAVSEELAELDLDREMGRVTEEDYQRWRRQLEPASPPADVAAPAPDPVDAAARAEDLVRQWTRAGRPTCPTCGERPEPGARFCSNCGAGLAP